MRAAMTRDAVPIYAGGEPCCKVHLSTGLSVLPHPLFYWDDLLVGLRPTG